MPNESVIASNSSTVGDGVQQQSLTEVTFKLANHCPRARREGKEGGWKVECPICHHNSLSITPKLSVLVFCHHCKSASLNDGHSPHRKHFIDAGLLEPDFRGVKLDPKQLAEYDAKRRAEALFCWKHGPWRSTSIDNEAGKYLQARRLERFIGHPILRFDNYNGVRLFRSSCNLATPVWNVEHGFSAIQFTALLHDGSDRNRDLGRHTHGVMKGGGVWITFPWKTTISNEVVIAEGLESLLSAMILLGMDSGVAVLGAQYIEPLVLPDNVRKIVIAADNDEVGRASALKASNKWKYQGLRVEAVTISGEGRDFSDELCGRE
jgi:hypothetical protein